MKKLIALLLIAVMMLNVVACSSKPTAVEATPTAAPAEPKTEEKGGEEPVAAEAPFNFKIGILTTNIAGASEEPYRTALKIQEKYGKDHIIIDSWPVNASAELETAISKCMAMAADPDVKAIVFCHALSGTMACIQAIKEKRPDIYTVACSPSDDVAQLSQVADLCMNKDQYMLGEQIVNQAINAGATTFIHYSMPRHMAQVLTAARGELIREACVAHGITFEYVTIPDPTSDVGVAGAQQFVVEDVPEQIKKYGDNVAFFTTVNETNEVLIKTVCENHGIFITQSDPTPFNHFPGAMSIEVPEERRGDTEWMLAQLSARAAELNMTGRISCWKLSILDLFERVGVEYAIAHIQGKTNDADGKIDLNDLKTIAEEVAGTQVNTCYITNSEGVEYKNYLGLLCGLYIM